MTSNQTGIEAVRTVPNNSAVAIAEQLNSNIALCDIAHDLIANCYIQHIQTYASIVTFCCITCVFKIKS